MPDCAPAIACPLLLPAAAGRHMAGPAADGAASLGTAPREQLGPRFARWDRPKGEKAGPLCGKFGIDPEMRWGCAHTLRAYSTISKARVGKVKQGVGPTGALAALSGPRACHRTVTRALFGFHRPRQHRAARSLPYDRHDLGDARRPRPRLNAPDLRRRGGDPWLFRPRSPQR